MEEYYPDEIETKQGCQRKGLGLVVFGDWYNSDLLHSVKFFDENTRDSGLSNWWRKRTCFERFATPFGIGFGDKVFSGEVSDDRARNS